MKNQTEASGRSTYVQLGAVAGSVLALTTALAIAPFDQNEVATQTFHIQAPADSVSSTNASMPAFVHDDREALRFGQALNRSEDLRRLARRVLEDQARVGRPHDIDVWARTIAGHVAGLKD